MTEFPVMFGHGAHLMGIVSEPSTASGGDLGCLLLNVGVTHRIGPRRLNVKLARLLAERGVPCLRFDLSSIGDSAAARGGANFQQQAVLDIQAAMDELQLSCNVRRFVIIGMCSGAANGYWAAKADARVAGLLMFDGMTFPTRKTALVHDLQRLRTMSWGGVAIKFVRRVQRLLSGAPRQAVSIFNVTSDLASPSRSEFAATMNALVARGVAIYLVYSGSMLVDHNYHEQLADAFHGEPFLAGIRHEFRPDVDHLVTALALQQSLLPAICDWVIEQVLHGGEPARLKPAHTAQAA